MGLTGEAIVTNIQSAPAVRSGNGRVVTATFKHSSGDCINLALSSDGTAETIGTTSNHPFWSVDRQDYVQAGSLQLDERVQTYSGDTKRVISKLARPGPEPVYNLEVHGEHVYYVGQRGILVHNTQGYKTDAVAGVDPEILVRHRAGNTQVVHNGTRWNLPTRDTSVLPKSDVLGDHIQQLAYKHAQNFKFKPTAKQLDTLATLQSEGVNTYGVLKRWEGQAKGRYVDTLVKRDLAISHPHLALNSKGVDIFDSQTGLSYELLYKSAKNIHTHAMRMPTVKFRYIEFR